MYSSYIVLGLTTQSPKSWVPPVLHPLSHVSTSTTTVKPVHVLDVRWIDPGTLRLVSQCVNTVPYPLTLAKCFIFCIQL